MNLLTPLRLGVGLTQTVVTTGVRVALAGPRLVATLLQGGPAAAADEVRDTVVDAAVNGSPGAAEAREAAVRDAQAFAAAAPAGPTARPEPTSASGASGGVGGTLDAEGDAGRVGAPDPTGDTPVLPQGERRTVDVAPPTREKTIDDTDEVVLSFGDPDTPGATLDVEEPWDGYRTAKVGEVLSRLASADEATKAVVLLYEQQHKGRKRVMEAARTLT